MLREEKRRQTPLGLQAEQLTSRGLLLPDETIIELVRGWFDRNERQFLFDGFPRSVGQAEALAGMLSQRDALLDAVLAIECPDSILEQRILIRLVCLSCGQVIAAGRHVPNIESPCPRCGGRLGRRSDDTPEALRVRLQEYRQKTAPLTEYYEKRGILRRIDGAAEPDAVFKTISAILEN